MSRKLILALVIANEIRGALSATVMAKDLNANGWQMTASLWHEACILIAIGAFAVWMKKHYKSKA